jgi:hypothetical protein
MMPKTQKRCLVSEDHSQVNARIHDSSQSHANQHFVSSERTQVKKRKLMDTTIENVEVLLSPPKMPSIPDPKQGAAKPDLYLKELVFAVVGENLQVTPASTLDGFFPTATEKQKAGYTMEIVSAARTNNVDKLRQLRDSGKAMNCFNRFGESLLHMACRRGFKEMIEFLLNDPEIEVRVADDCGRTPMHDTCWALAPNLDIARWIIEREPSLLFTADSRGFTPFDYARPEHWNTWKQFLYDNRGCLKKLGSEEICSRFSGKYE